MTNGGTVNVYLLSTGPNPGSDSVWLGGDGTDQQVTTGSTGTWIWKKPSAAFSLPTGSYTLTIKNREDSTQVDKIYLTTGSTAPTGLGGTALTPQYGSVVSGWLAAYHPSAASDTVLATSGLAMGGTVSLHLPVKRVAAAPHTSGPAMPAASLSRTLTYQYDGLQRLTGATDSTGTTYAYTYDLGGNRTSATVNGVTTTRSSNAANQVVGWTYDTVGNLTNDGTTTYGYDALNRQTSTGGITNTYNGDGVLVQQGTTRYTQDLVAPLSQILSDGTQTYVYGYERLYGLNGTTKIWYGTDALGSVRYTMNAAGVASTPITYDPWGGVASGSVPTFGFTGEMQQGGLVNLRARWYSTGEGRFGSRDPEEGCSANPSSLHPYQYGYHNPITNRDPSGRCTIELYYRTIEGAPLGHHADMFVHCDPDQERCQDGHWVKLYGKPEYEITPSKTDLAWMVADFELRNKYGYSPLETLSPWGDVQGFPRRTSGPQKPHSASVARLEVLRDQEACDEYVRLMEDYLIRVNAAHIPYNPLDRNSNAVINGAINAIGLWRPWPPVYAPGSFYNLFGSIPLFPPVGPWVPTIPLFFGPSHCTRW